MLTLSFRKERCRIRSKLRARRREAKTDRGPWNPSSKEEDRLDKGVWRELEGGQKGERSKASCSLPSHIPLEALVPQGDFSALLNRASRTL